MSYAIKVCGKSSIGNRNSCVNAWKRVRKIIHNNIDDHIMVNNNFLNYDSIFGYFNYAKIYKILHHNEHEYFSNNLTLLMTNIHVVRGLIVFQISICHTSPEVDSKTRSSFNQSKYGTLLLTT